MPSPLRLHTLIGRNAQASVLASGIGVLSDFGMPLLQTRDPKNHDHRHHHVFVWVPGVIS